MTLLAVNDEVLTPQGVFAVSVVDKVQLLPTQRAVTLLADAILHLALVKVFMAGRTIGLDGFELPADMAAVAIDLHVLPYELEASNVVVGKIVDLPLLHRVTVPAKFVLELPLMKIDVTAVARGGDRRFQIISRMTSIAVDIVMSPHKVKFGDAVIETYLQPVLG